MNQYRKEAELGPWYGFSARFRRILTSALRLGFLFAIFWLGSSLPDLFSNASALLASIPAAMHNASVPIGLRIVGLMSALLLASIVLWLVVGASESIGITSEALFGKRDFLSIEGLGRRALRPLNGPVSALLAYIAVVMVASKIVQHA
jgi:hypothetical protein